jgi:hypothetical protein
VLSLGATTDADTVTFGRDDGFTAVTMDRNMGGAAEAVDAAAAAVEAAAAAVAADEDAIATTPAAVAAVAVAAATG